MIVYRRKVRFEELDAARIVFFARFFSYLHEAMEHFFDELEGGYAAYTSARGLCFSTVKLDSIFQAPLRYGEEVAVETEAIHLGNRSATLRYGFVRADGHPCARFEHTIVSMDLGLVQSCDMPADVRALLSRHLAPDVGRWYGWP